MRALRRFLFAPDQRVRRLLRRVHRDESGNVIVLYVAASLLLVGMLWAVIGTGARMVQKETIQSSADAAAFSAAVIKAKGLNIIAFCNLVMALLLAIIMLLRLIKATLIVVTAICTAACFDIFGGEVLCAFAPTMASLTEEYSNLEAQVEPRMMDAMRGLSKLERAIDKSFPALALAEAYRVGTHDSYKRNFGKGTLITIAWPLPVGKDLGLPTKDGTWDELCEQATQTFGRVVDAALTKIGLPSVIGDLFASAITTLLEPLKGVLCPDGTGGGSSTVQLDSNETKGPGQCDQCDGATSSTWSGEHVTRNPDGSLTSLGYGQCKLTWFSGSLCSGGGGVTTCGDGSLYRNLQFQSCLVPKKVPADLGGQLSDKPLPLDLADDWKDHVDVRAYTLLTDANVAERRKSVAVASKQKGTSPTLNQLIATAQAEVFAWNGHEDLWHMNWRARLKRFSFGGTSGGDVGDAAGQGVPTGGADAILGVLGDFLSNNVGAALADQFMVH